MLNDTTRTEFHQSLRSCIELLEIPDSEENDTDDDDGSNTSCCNTENAFDTTDTPVLSPRGEFFHQKKKKEKRSYISLLQTY